MVETKCKTNFATDHMHRALVRITFKSLCVLPILFSLSFFGTTKEHVRILFWGEVKNATKSGELLSFQATANIYILCNTKETSSKTETNSQKPSGIMETRLSTKLENKTVNQI